MSLLAELRRRNVPRAAVFYAASAWLLVQVATQVFPLFHIAEWVLRWIVIAAVVGFPITMSLSWFYEWTPQGLRRESEVAPAESIRHETGKKLDRWIIVVLAAAVVLLLTDRFVLHKDANLAADNSIAVLPLTNEGDKEQQFFSDGLSENFIVALSQFSGLKVIGRNSSFQFRDTKDDSRSIGEKLGVATLLEGSVQHAGDAVRISAELIRAADGSTIWTQRYDRPYKDLFALQDDITQSVAAALKTKLLASDTAATQTDRPPSGSLDAYSAYLQGKFYFARSSEADWRKALEHYATATRIDPRYALAWVGSSHTRGWLAAQYLGGAEAQQLNAQARSDLDTALKLEPNLAAAHMVRGELLSAQDFDWSGAEAEFRRALQLEPNNSDALENLGVLFATLGQTEPALQLIQQSLITDPLRPGGFMLLSRIFASEGRLDEAEQSIRKAIALQPASGIFDATLAIIEVQRGDAKAALTEAGRTLPGGWQDYALAMAQQIGNDRAAADAALRLAIDKDADGMAFQIAQIQALRRDPDQTFAWLERALANRDPGLQFLLVDRFLLRYQGDPRFAVLCKKVGLPATTTAKALP